MKGKILVTGGAGQIGSHLVARLVDAGAHVSVADNLWRGKKSNLVVKDIPLIDMKRDFSQVDLMNYEECLKVVRGKNVVYHLADIVAGINYVFGNQFSVYSANVTIDSNMLRAAIQCGVEKFIYVGSACSYPAEKQRVIDAPLFKEDDVYPASPESSYGWSKLMGEYACELCRAEGLMNIGVLRLHNVYGPHCEMSPEKSQVIPALIRKAINHPSEEFVVWGSGRQRRAFLFVDDAVDALVSAFERGINKGVIQIGPDKSTSVGEVAQRIIAISGKSIRIRFDTTKREGDIDRAADWTKAKELLGWSPKTDIETGLRNTYEWCYRQAKVGDKYLRI